MQRDANCPELAILVVIIQNLLAFAKSAKSWIFCSDEGSSLFFALYGSAVLPAVSAFEYDMLNCLRRLMCVTRCCSETDDFALFEIGLEDAMEEARMVPDFSEGKNVVVMRGVLLDLERITVDELATIDRQARDSMVPVR